MAVEAIDDKVMREFIPWRRDYYADFKKLPKNAKRHPTDRTIQFDMMVGKAIVRWAAEKGLRGNRPAITATFTPKKKRVRPAFELSEFRLLVEKAIRTSKWWQPDSNGGYVMTLKVGSKRVEFEKGKAAIAVGSLEKLPGVIDALIKAVRAGELDEQLKQLSKFGRSIPERKAG